MPELKGFMVPRTPEGRSSIVPPPPWHYSGDVLTIEYRAEPARVAALLARWRRPRRGGSRRRGDHLGRLAVVRRVAGRAPRSRPLPVQGVFRRRPVQMERRALLALRLHLGGQGLRARPGLVPGLSEEARVDLDDPAGDGREGRTAARGRRAVRGDACGERPAPRPGVAHPHRGVGDGRLRERAPDAALAMDARDRPVAAGRVERAGHDALARMSSSDRSTPETRRSSSSTRRATSCPRCEPYEMIAGYWRQVGATFAGGTKLA